MLATQRPHPRSDDAHPAGRRAPREHALAVSACRRRCAVKVAGAIIAGGPAQRLGGVAKPFLTVGGRADRRAAAGSVSRGRASRACSWSPTIRRRGRRWASRWCPIWSAASGRWAASTPALDARRTIATRSSAWRAICRSSRRRCSRRCATARPAPTRWRRARRGGIEPLCARYAAGAAAGRRRARARGRAGDPRAAGAGWRSTGSTSGELAALDPGRPQLLQRQHARGSRAAPTRWPPRSGRAAVTTRGWAVAAGGRAAAWSSRSRSSPRRRFIGDDHLFLAFARHAPHPFVAVRVRRARRRVLPPAADAGLVAARAAGRRAARRSRRSRSALHAGAAALTGLLLRALGRPVAVACGAARPDVARAPEPGRRVLVLGEHGSAGDGRSCSAALIALVRGRLSPPAARGARRVSVQGVGLRAAAAGAAGAGAACRGGRRAGGDRASAGAARRGPGGARGRVLHGWGGAGDARAGARRRSSCRSRAGSPTCSRATAVMPEPLAFGVGTAIVALAAFAAIAAAAGTAAAPACCRSRSARSRRRRCSRPAGRSARATSICRRSGSPGRRRRRSRRPGIAARVALACVAR